MRLYPFYPKVLALGGVVLMGIGLYLILLRPPLLPEDARYMGTTLAGIQMAAPGSCPLAAKSLLGDGRIYFHRWFADDLYCLFIF